MDLSWNNATEPSDSLIKSIRIRIYRTVQCKKEHTDFLNLERWEKFIFAAIKMEKLCNNCDLFQRINDTKHSLRILFTEASDIFISFCAFTPEYSSSCNHVVTALYKIEYANERADKPHLHCTIIFIE